LPEEIAELAKEVNSPDNSLGKYRDANLAPSDVDTEGNSSDGSSMGTTTDLGSPVMRAKQVLAAENDVPGPGPNVPQTKTKLVTYELSIPSYSGEMMKTHIQANASIEVIADFICERGQELHAPVANIAKAVDAFLKDPESFVVDDAVMGGTNKNKDVGRIQAEKHVFVKVIGMIPVTLFWVVVKPVAWYVDKAYEALVGKLNGLGLGGKKNDA
jgi:hypothetical protein